MKFRSCALALALSVAAVAPAGAMYLNPQGTGQVLLFPYFTVNSGQSTLIKLVNTTPRAKALKIRLHEGYNGRVVLDFWIMLAARDTWTGTLFSTDASGAARIMTRDGSCTAPDKPAWEAPFPGGGYQQSLLPWDYSGSREDSGPTNLARTREGYFEIIEVAELVGNLAAAVTGPQPLNCAAVQVFDPTSPDIRPPGGGLYGAFSIVDSAEGTLIGGNATAVADFSQVPLVADTASILEYLAAGNSRPGEVDAVLPAGHGGLALTYPTTGSPNRAQDALTALLMTDSLYGQMSREATSGSQTEWVVTAPTKFLYTDHAVLGVPLGSARGALPPFEAVFGGPLPGASCSRYAAEGFDREGRPIRFALDPVAGPLPQHALCYATNIVHFSDRAADGTTPLLGSRLGSKLWNPTPAVGTAEVRIDLGARAAGSARGDNVLPPGLAGPALRGLPMIGFEAVRYVNGNIEPGVLANYTTATPLRGSVACTTAVGRPIGCP